MTVPEIKRLAKKPTQISYNVQETPYGDMMIGVCDQGVCWMGFDLDGKLMRARFPEAEFVEQSAPFEDTVFAVYGTDFQISVWNELLKISCGDTKTYGEIANDLGKPKANRAVGSAVGANPVSAYIPCHRVLPASGGVGSYLWGSAKKAEILNLENLSL